MYLYGALIVIAVIIGFIIYNEIKKNKQYQKEREERLQKQKDKRRDTLQVRVKSKETQKAPSKPEPTITKEPQVKPQVKEEVKSVQTQPKKEIQPQKEVAKPSVDLPECNYPEFDHSRLIEMGLGESDAQEFVGDLINQIEEQIPKIDNAIETEDIENLERLTHSIKGSSTNIGVGGVADLLVEFNTYTKTKSNIDVIKEYFKQLKVYLEKLKKQYS